MAEVTHRRKCKGFFERCAKNKKIFAIPPARDRPAAGPPRGPSAAPQHAERERPRAGARSARGHRPRAARRAAAGRQLAPIACAGAIGRGHRPPCRGHRPGPASCRPRTGAGSGSAGSVTGLWLTELTEPVRQFCAQCMRGAWFRPFAGAAALGQLGQLVIAEKLARLDMSYFIL